MYHIICIIFILVPKYIQEKYMQKNRNFFQ